MQYFFVSRYEDVIVNSEKALQHVYDFLDEETSRKVKSKMASIYCYSPVFNKMKDKQVVSLNDTSSILQNKVTQTEANAKYESFAYRRKNYDCFSINKWRYTANERFIKLVESSCVNIMSAMGYKQLGQNTHLQKEFSHSLIYPEYKKI